MDKPQIISHFHKSVNYTIFDCKWIPCSAKFVIIGSHARGTGAFEIYELTKDSAQVVHTCEKPKPFKCGTFGASTLDERYCATGDFDGRLSIWNLEDLTVPIYSVKAHEEIINCIDGVGGLGIGKGAPEIVTGSRDGLVKIWDPRVDKAVSTIAPTEGETKRDCWSVAFGNSYDQSERLVCAGYDNGDVKMIDLRNMSIKWEHNVKNGICSVQFDRKDIAMNKLVIGCLESKLHVVDLRTYNSKKGFSLLTEKVQKSTIWKIAHLPQNRDVFMSTAGNGSLNLWKYNYPVNRVSKTEDGDEGVMGTLDCLQNVTLSTQPIHSFDWSPDKLGLAVCSSFDQSFRVLIVTKLNTL